MLPLRRIGYGETSGGLGFVRLLILAAGDETKKSGRGHLRSASSGDCNDDLAGKPAPVCRKGEWRGYREGASGLSRGRRKAVAPNTLRW